MTLMSNVQNVAESLARVLGFEWEALGAKHQKLFLVHSFRTYEATRENLVQGMDVAADVLRDALEDPSTPKNRLLGLTYALQLINDEADAIDEGDLVQLPDAVPDRLDQRDEYPDLEAEMSDPYAAQRLMVQLCGEPHPTGGWTCTRPVHPPHWKHFDSDPSITDDDIPNVIHAVWDSEGDITSIRERSTIQDDGDDE